MNFKHNETLIIKQKPIFEIPKQDILDGKISMKIDQGLNKILKLKNLNFVEEINTKKNIKSKIIDTLTKLNIYPDNQDKIQTIQIFSDGKLFILLDDNKKITFNLEKENIYYGEEKQIKELKEKETKKSIKILEKTDKILEVIKKIFEKNERGQNILKFDFGEINDEDIASFGTEFDGKNLKELQRLFNENFDIVRQIDKEYFLSDEAKKILLKQEKDYLEIFMGIGNTYEGAAGYLQETFTDYGNIIDDIINLSNNKQALDYLLELHRKIDTNNYQSETVEASYKVLISVFHQKIFDKLVKNNASNKEFLRYAKIVTGRENINDEMLGFDANFINDNIDDNLRDQERANEAILYIVNRKNGILEKLNKKNIIEDNEVKNQKPLEIVDNLRKKFYEKFGKQNMLTNVFDIELANSGYNDVLKLDKNITYDQLNLSQKTKISILYRVGKKLEQGKDFKEKFIGGLLNLGKILDLKNPWDIKKDYVIGEFASLFESVAKDYKEENAKTFETLLDGDFEIKNNLSDEEKEAIELFKDIYGVGVFDLSDSSIEGYKTLGQIIGIMGVGIATFAGVSGVIAGGAVAGLTSTLTGIALNPKGYDTFGEATEDIGSDMLLGTLTGFVGGGATFVLEKEGAKFFSKEILRNSKFIMAGDLVLLGVIPEVKRQEILRKKFGEKEFLIKGEENEEEVKKIHPNFGKQIGTKIDIEPLYFKEKNKNNKEFEEKIDQKIIKRKINIINNVIEKLGKLGNFENKIIELKLEKEILEKKLNQANQKNLDKLYNKKILEENFSNEEKIKIVNLKRTINQLETLNFSNDIIKNKIESLKKQLRELVDKK